MKLERLEGSKRILSSAKKSDWICFEHDKFFYIVFGVTLDSKFDWKQMNYLWNIAPLIWKDRWAQFVCKRCEIVTQACTRWSLFKPAQGGAFSTINLHTFQSRIGCTLRTSNVHHFKPNFLKHEVCLLQIHTETCWLLVQPNKREMGEQYSGSPASAFSFPDVAFG